MTLQRERNVSKLWKGVVGSQSKGIEKKNAEITLVFVVVEAECTCVFCFFFLLLSVV